MGRAFQNFQSAGQSQPKKEPKKKQKQGILLSTYLYQI